MKASVHMHKQNARAATPIGIWMSSSGSMPIGYHRILDSPEIGSCINRMAEIISCCTLYLMQNGKDGDKRIKGGLSRLVDIEPWPGMMDGHAWKAWIVTELLGNGDGNAFILPRFEAGRIAALEPMPGAIIIPGADRRSYTVQWRERVYNPDSLVHIKLFPDPDEPWRGRGYRFQASRLAASLGQTADLKDSLNAPDYKPPMIVYIDSDADYTSDTKREELRKRYLEDADKGKPWMLPKDLISVQQLDPLSLNDLAIKDTVELDKRTAAAIFGMPPFLLGVGNFDEKAYNNFIHGPVLNICKAIESQLTLGILESEDLYYQFNRRKLYSYDLASLMTIDLAMMDRGVVNGDEVRDDDNRSPAGLKEFRVLENYIPWDAAGNQTKLLSVSKLDTNGGDKNDSK